MGLFSKPLLSLSFSLYLQTGIKYVLTEGDKYLISALATLKDTGMYALSANYGGLIARMLFRPIEDSSRNLFANLCSDAAEARRVGGVTKKGDSKQSNANIGEAAAVLGDILRIYGLVSLIAFAIGPHAAPLLLRLVAGTQWSDTGAGEVLGTYCYYIPLLAINGVSEAFVSATASTKELRRQSIWMGAFSVAFAASAYLFLRVLQMGAKGLVLANCVNMASRILFNMSFVKYYFGQRDVVSTLIPLALDFAHSPAGIPYLAHSTKSLCSRCDSGGAGSTQSDAGYATAVRPCRRSRSRRHHWSIVRGLCVRCYVSMPYMYFLKHANPMTVLPPSAHIFWIATCDSVHRSWITLMVNTIFPVRITTCIPNMSVTLASWTAQ